MFHQLFLHATSLHAARDWTSPSSLPLSLSPSPSPSSPLPLLLPLSLSLSLSPSPSSPLPLPLSLSLSLSLSPSTSPPLPLPLPLPLYFSPSPSPPPPLPLPLSLSPSPSPPLPLPLPLPLSYLRSRFRILTSKMLWDKTRPRAVSQKKRVGQWHVMLSHPDFQIGAKFISTNSSSNINRIDLFIGPANEDWNTEGFYWSFIHIIIYDNITPVFFAFYTSLAALLRLAFDFMRRSFPQVHLVWLKNTLSHPYFFHSLMSGYRPGETNGKKGYT